MHLNSSLFRGSFFITACPRKNQPPQVSQCNLSIANNSCYKEVLNDIDLKELKKCGPIFDGCKVFNLIRHYLFLF